MSLDGALAPVVDAASSNPDAAPATDAMPISLAGVSCTTPPPPGAPQPPPLPAYSGGSCPTLVAGDNAIMSSGAARRFTLVVPAGFDPETERLPIFFMWHHIGGDASSMVSNGMAQEAADDMRVLVAIPEKKGDVTLPIANVDLAWPYMDFSTPARVEQEAVLFDDILACLAAQYPVNEQCVSTVGVSAGALWTSQLIQRRSERLASALIISGGIGPTGGFGGFADLRGWGGNPRAIPVLYGWGGSSDTCGGINFARASDNLGGKLATGGNFVIECVHNCGHAAPPVDPAVGLPILYRFALEHPYWLPAGRSPWGETGLPEGSPDWCSIGVENATPRTGECPSQQTCPF